MDNAQISDSFLLLSKLMDIHGENSFKSKAYASASFKIDKLPLQLKDLPEEKIHTLAGIGQSAAQKIIELLQTGKIFFLEEIIQKTPPGVIEMLSIKGIGPKKINTIWKEMEIESVGELLYACKENRLKLYKGFGEKTQENVIQNIEFYFKNQGSHLYAQAEMIADEIDGYLKSIFPEIAIQKTGKFLRRYETIEALEFIIQSSPEEIEKSITASEIFSLKDRQEEFILYSTDWGIDVKIYATDKNTLVEKSILLGSSEAFSEALFSEFPLPDKTISSVAEYFDRCRLQYIPENLREFPSIIGLAKEQKIPTPVETADIRGIIHSHSNWSDGNNTIEEMAAAAIEQGLEYLVISDHSKSAFYAQGLSEERVKAQHQYIDELNRRLTPFRIFKSIESDILNDGSLDYSDSILSTFDLVIASVHSNLKMNEEKAMMRLLRAIENPYTTILGHMTGRLLLSRPGYPVQHKKIIDACAANNVAIELNAHPSRLDIDWRHISYALEKKVLISINPDAHSTEGFSDVRYGVLTAQKALVTKEDNLSSFSLSAFEHYLSMKSGRKS